MKNIFKIELTTLQKSFLWGLSGASILIKIFLDSFFLLVEEYSQPFALILRFIFSIIIFLSLLVIFFAGFKQKLTHRNTSYDKYTSELIQISIFYLVLLIFTSFLPSSLIGGGTPNTFVEIIYINFFAFAGLILSLMILHFFFKWVWFRRYKSTKKQLKIIGILIIAQILLLDLPNYFTHLAPEEIKSNTFLFVLSLILNISLIVVVFLSSKKNEWIASLNLGEKWKIFGLSFSIIILTILIFGIDSPFEGDGKLSNAINSIFPTASLFGMATVIILIYSIRITLASLLSMPTTSIIEKKYNEFHSLTYLNKVITQTIDFDNLIETVSNLSLASGGGHIAWTDIFSDDGTVLVHSIYSSAKLPESKKEVIRKLEEQFYRDNSLEMFRNLSSPHYIESIPLFENSAVRKLTKIFDARALIIVPLLSGTKRIGTLYLTHNNEYGFDSDFLTLLSAFSNNLNIAIENISLLEASIEKEKYKKELMIARDIAGKLIPEIIPNFDNYSLSGYTLPAEEVGGDYYDIIKLKDGKRCLLIGDVSGKGMSAAFYMVLLKGVVLSVKNQVQTPAELLRKINCVLFKEMEKQMFITMSAIKIEDENGNLTLARAGHLPFLIKRKEEIIEIKPKGIGVGLAPASFFDKTIEEVSYHLEDKESIIVYSDGIVEIFKDNLQIQDDFLKQIINKSVYFSSRELLDDISEQIDVLKKEYKFVDDMTILCLTKEKNNTEIENA